MSIRPVWDSNEHQTSLGQLGEEPELSNSTSEACEAFICTAYSKAKQTGTKVNDQCQIRVALSKGTQKWKSPRQLTATREARKIPGLCMEESSGTTQSLPPAAGHGCKNSGWCPAACAHDQRSRTTGSSGADCHCKKSICHRADCPTT